MNLDGYCFSIHGLNKKLKNVIHHNLDVRTSNELFTEKHTFPFIIRVLSFHLNYTN